MSVDQRPKALKLHGQNRRHPDGPDRPHRHRRRIDFALALEAQARGHKLWYYLPKHLVQRDGKISARAQTLTVRNERGNHFTLGAPETIDLGAVDVVLLRQDPPFDMGYITTTHILERLPKSVLVVNDPYWVRNSPEKIFVTEFPDLMPPTLITSDAEAIRAFRAEHGEIIVKPLYGTAAPASFASNRRTKISTPSWNYSAPSCANR